MQHNFLKTFFLLFHKYSLILAIYTCNKQCISSLLIPNLLFLIIFIFLYYNVFFYIYFSVLQAGFFLLSNKGTEIYLPIFMRSLIQTVVPFLCYSSVVAYIFIMSIYFNSFFSLFNILSLYLVPWEYIYRCKLPLHYYPSQGTMYDKDKFI